MRLFAIRLLVAWIGLCFAPTALNAQTLWQNTTAGMTVQQVRAAQPEATTVAHPDQLYNGATCELKLKNYSVAANTYDVCFYFKDLRLIQVTLGFLGEPTRANYDDLVLLLTAKYGPPLHETPDSIGRSAYWILPGGANVALTYIDERSIPLININYQLRVASESSKL